MGSGVDCDEVDWQVKEVEVCAREVLDVGLDEAHAVQDDGGTWGEVGVAHEGMVVHFGVGCDELQSLGEHEQVVGGMSEIWMGVRLDGMLVREVDGLHFRFRDHGRGHLSSGFEIWVGARVWKIF